MRYQNQYTSRRRSSFSRNSNITPFASSVKLGPITHTVIITLLITVLGLIYLTQAGRLTSYDYQSSRIDNKIAELSSKKKDLEIEKARLTALSTIESSSVAQNMTKPAKTSYLNN